MKTNEAPEKIYVKITHPISDEYTEIIAFEDGDGVEYTRTDAFIEKAEKWLEENVMKYLITTIHAGTNVPDIKDEFFDDFKNYMKGE